MSLGRTVHLARVVSSICDRLGDRIPMSIARLAELSGERMTGGRATAGRVAATRPTRSCTSCRARIGSVSRGKKSTTELRPSTDLDWMFATQLVPSSAFSRGMVTRFSTLVTREPGCLGLDLDQRRRKLGEDVERNVPQQPRCGEHRQQAQRHHGDPVLSAAAMRPRISRRLQRRRAELGAEQLHRAGLHHHRAGRRTLGEQRLVAHHIRRVTSPSSVDLGRGPLVHPGAPAMSRTTADHGTTLPVSWSRSRTTTRPARRRGRRPSRLAPGNRGPPSPPRRWPTAGGNHACLRPTLPGPSPTPWICAPAPASISRRSPA